MNWTPNSINIDIWTNWLKSTSMHWIITSMRMCSVSLSSIERIKRWVNKFYYMEKKSEWLHWLSNPFYPTFYPLWSRWVYIIWLYASPYIGTSIKQVNHQNPFRLLIFMWFSVFSLTLHEHEHDGTGKCMSLRLWVRSIQLSDSSIHHNNVTVSGSIIETGVNWFSFPKYLIFTSILYWMSPWFHKFMSSPHWTFLVIQYEIIITIYVIIVI